MTTVLKGVRKESRYWHEHAEEISLGSRSYQLKSVESNTRRKQRVFDPEP